MLTAISPIDGRYQAKSAVLSDYFSEYALIRYRVLVEVHYFLALVELPLPQLANFPPAAGVALLRRCNQLDLVEAEKIKAIEKVTNHDVKAVEYYLKGIFQELELEAFQEFIHFGLTSQDINNTAIPLALKHALEQVIYPQWEKLEQALAERAYSWAAVPMLARTHGQPATPTTLGKEIRVFGSRIAAQLQQLRQIPHQGKFGGATGGFNAHRVAYPQVDWPAFGRQFLQEKLGLTRAEPTTQIEHYDHLAGQCQAMMRLNTILIDCCRDFWTYISLDYFKQQVVANEVGSSAMPHKVNPIDFENAEGNLGLANAIFGHLAEKLPISRLQRDLTDSTVLRNLGVPIAHTLIALDALLRGLGKLVLNPGALEQDLQANWLVVAEAIQTILRREGYPQPYEALKALTRGTGAIDQAALAAFIDGLTISAALKAELKAITPFNYLGMD